MDYSMGVIEKIEKMREERDWTKYKLADEANITYSSLMSMYARNTPPKLDILEMICAAFGVSLAQFFSDDTAAEILSSDEKDLVRNYRRLTDEKKNAVKILIKP